MHSVNEAIALSDPNDVKASFDDIYVMPDPRAYYSVLGSLDYAIPDLANPIFRQLANAWRANHGRSATILDLGSSYGINSALFRYPLTFAMLRRRYAQRAVLKLPTEDMLALDQHYFQSWPRTQAERLIVSDVSEPAVNYAVRAGIADAGVVGSFEEGLPSVDAGAKLAGVNMIVSTGCVGYVTERSFSTLLESVGGPVWVASFVLRMFDYAPVEAVLAKFGLRTEKLDAAAFVQRRFRDEDEAKSVLALLAEKGVDPTGLESDGLLFAELYVSRPEEEVAKAPLDSIVTIASGSHMTFGPRFMQVRRGGKSELAPVRT